MVTKKIAIFLFILTIFSLISSCQSSLPQEAREALDEELRNWTNDSYTITSSVKAKEPNVRSWEKFDEAWCVVIDPPVKIGVWESHFIIGREGLYWTVDGVPDNWESDFLKRGCNNW
jgi:hypothetical protein